MAITNLLTAYSDLDDLMTPVSTVEAIAPGATATVAYTAADGSPDTITITDQAAFDFLEPTVDSYITVESNATGDLVDGTYKVTAVDTSTRTITFGENTGSVTGNNGGTATFTKTNSDNTADIANIHQYTTSVVHGLKVGDYVNIVNIANNSGVFNGRYQVTEIVSTTVFKADDLLNNIEREAIASAATTGVAASVGDLEPGLIVEESLSEVVSGGTPNDTNDTLALGSGQVAAIDVAVNDYVTIANSSDASVVDGTYEVTAVSTDTLTFAATATPAAGSTTADFTIFKSDASGNALIRGSYRTSEITVIAVQPDGSKTKTIKFNITENGALENAGTGITGQALYSYFKFLWKNVQSITQFDFPMLSITNEQFEFINSWYLDDASTINQKLVLASSNFSASFTSATVFTSSVSDVDLRKLQAGDNITISSDGSNDTATATVSSVGYNRSTGVYTVTTSDGAFDNPQSETISSISTVVNVKPSNLIRTAGWTVQNGTGEYQKLYYSGVITLGTLVDETDTPYYVQRDALTAGTNDTKYSGPANEGVRIRSVADARSSAANVTIVYTSVSAGGGASTIAEDTTDKIDWTAFEVGDFIEITDASVTASGITGVLHEITAVSSTGITTGSTFGASDQTTGSALIEADFSGTFKIFVRELGKTFADADLDDIGVSEMTYIVYRFPVTNSSDADVPTSIEDISIDSGGITAALPAGENPYDDIQISYLEASAGVPYDIKGTIESGAAIPVSVGEVYKDGAGRWFKVTVAGNINTTTGAGAFADYTITGSTDISAYEGEREISDVYYAFTVIVDANDNHANAGSPYVDDGNNTSASQVYLFIQWALRRSADGGLSQGQINEGAAAESARVGNIADRLVTFVGPTLTTQPGVFIDSIASTDQNNVSFTEATVGGVNVGSGTTYVGGSGLKYPLTVTVRIDFNDNLQADADAVFYMYYSDGTGSGYGAQDFSATQATQVKKSDGNDVGSDVNNAISAAQSYQFQYGYEEDATAGRTPGTNVSVTTVAIGLSSGQYVKSTATITNTGATISLVAPLERNYSNA